MRLYRQTLIKKTSGSDAEKVYNSGLDWIVIVGSIIPLIIIYFVLFNFSHYLSFFGSLLNILGLAGKDFKVSDFSQPGIWMMLFGFIIAIVFQIMATVKTEKE